jgi:hypothetical protein
MFLYSAVTGLWVGIDLQYRRLIRYRSQVLRYIARPMESTTIWLSDVIHELAPHRKQQQHQGGWEHRATLNFTFLLQGRHHSLA